MKLKKGFVLREVAGQTVVVSVSTELNIHAMLALNDTAKTLWLALEQENDIDGLTKALLAEYKIDEEKARADAMKFVDKLKGLNFLE